MHRPVRGVGVVLLPVLLFACASSAPRPAVLADLVGSWQLVAEVPAGARIPTLAIGSDGSLAGNSGVNRFRSRLDGAALAQGQLRLDALSGTEMAGPAAAMQLEQTFLQLLTSADRAMIEGGHLLLLQGGQAVLRFAPIRLR